LPMWWGRSGGRNRQTKSGEPADAQASSPPLYKLLTPKASTRVCRVRLRFIRGLEDVAQVDFVELHRGLGGGLERGFHLGRFVRGGLERLGQAEAQRGEGFRVGLLLLRRRGRAVDALRHADEDRARELEVGILERVRERGLLVRACLVRVAHAGERSGGAGRLARTKNMEPTPASSASTVKPVRKVPVMSASIP